MTKKEQAQVDALAKALAEARALCYPQYPKPKSMTVDELTPAENKYAGGVVVAWHQHNHDCNYRVGQGCSNGTSHSRWSTEKTNSQTPGVFYRTKIEALQAARHEMTERFAQALARIDAEIEFQMSESRPQGSDSLLTPTGYRSFLQENDHG